MDHEAINQRLRMVTRACSLREVAGQIGMHPEQVRRSFGGAVQLQVVMAICDRFNARADWVLFGRGEVTPERERQRIERSLASASAMSRVAEELALIEDGISALERRAVAICDEVAARGSPLDR